MQYDRTIICAGATRDKRTIDIYEMTSDTQERQGTYAVLTLLIQTLVVVGLILFLVRRDWENVFLTVLVLSLTLVPAFLLRRYRVYIPPEFQLVRVAFIFCLFFRDRLLIFITISGGGILSSTPAQDSCWASSVFSLFSS